MPLRGHKQEKLLLWPAAVIPLRGDSPLHGWVCWELPEVSEKQDVVVMLPCLDATRIVAGRWGRQIPLADQVYETRLELV